MVARVNSQIFTNSSYIWFLKFCMKIAIIGMAIFRKIVKIIYKANLWKSGNSFLLFFVKNDSLVSKMKVLIFLGIQPKILTRSNWQWDEVPNFGVKSPSSGWIFGVRDFSRVNFGWIFNLGWKTFPQGTALKQIPVLSQIGNEFFFGNFLPGSSNDYFNLVKHTNGVITQWLSIEIIPNHDRRLDSTKKHPVILAHSS